MSSKLPLEGELFRLFLGPRGGSTEQTVNPLQCQYMRYFAKTAGNTELGELEAKFPQYSRCL